mmetsp:Transcript_23304/g.48465  ORF Transcript_23304/g.48465 Transcript_23304/m.48465 type:complete len:211 (-) Transcript_23304:2260-2892(-)
MIFDELLITENLLETLVLLHHVELVSLNLRQNPYLDARNERHQNTWCQGEDWHLLFDARPRLLATIISKEVIVAVGVKETVRGAQPPELLVFFRPALNVINLDVFRMFSTAHIMLEHLPEQVHGKCRVHRALIEQRRRESLVDCVLRSEGHRPNERRKYVTFVPRVRPSKEAPEVVLSFGTNVESKVNLLKQVRLRFVNCRVRAKVLVKD